MDTFFPLPDRCLGSTLQISWGGVEEEEWGGGVWRRRGSNFDPPPDKSGGGGTFYFLAPPPPSSRPPPQKTSEAGGRGCVSNFSGERGPNNFFARFAQPQTLLPTTRHTARSFMLEFLIKRASIKAV